MKRMEKKEELLAIIERIKERFLQADIKGEKFESIEEILSKPVFLLKTVDKVAALTLGEIFKVKTIQDLASLDPEDPYESLVPKTIKKPEARLNRKKQLAGKAEIQFKSLNFNLQESIVVAQMISRAWEKRQIYAENTKKESKIICMGLDNAGKTALLSLIGGKTKFSEMAKLQPTRGVEWKDYGSKNFKLTILDMGGQADYRHKYLQDPEKYFGKVSAFLYVIDMQDSARYGESLEYFKQILQTLQTLGEKPQILIFLHKSDLDLINDPDYIINQEFIRGEFFKILEPEGTKSKFEFDLLPTSIYNFSAAPEFTTTVKDLLNVQSLNDPMLRKVQGLGEILDTLTNTMMSLTSQMETQIVLLGQKVAGLSTRFGALEQLLPAVVGSAPGVAPVKNPAEKFAVLPPGLVAPSPPPVPATLKVNPESAQSLRQNIMEELRAVFAKRHQIEDLE